MIVAIRKGSEDKYEDNQNYGTSWLKDLWTESEEQLCKAYKDQGMSICLLNPQENSDKFIEDCIVIRR